MKASHKRLKTSLAPRARKFGSIFVVLKLSEFLFFDDFLDLANFSLFGFPDLDNF